MVNKRKNFEFLAESFKKWVWKNLETYFEGLETDFFYGESHKELLVSLNMSKEAFIERFMNPYKGLSLFELLAVAKIQTELCNQQLKIPVLFKIKPFLEQYMNALEWTISNIADLEWFELDEEIRLFYKKPFKQCHSCGKEESDKRNPAKLFGEDNLLRCHTADCFPPVEDGSTEQHSDNCCANNWEIEIHNLRSSLNRILNKGSREQHLREQSAINSFVNFCDKQLKFNQSTLRVTIGTDEMRSKDIGIYDDLER